MGPQFHSSLAQGVALFNRQEFYEAHEAWEAGWIDEIDDQRLLLQGLIQVAAGFYKLQVGAPLGTVKLLEQGLSKLRKFLGRSEGVDLERLLPEVEAWLVEAKRLVAEQRRDYDPKRLPRLRYTPVPKRQIDLAGEPLGERAEAEALSTAAEETSLEVDSARTCPYCGEPVQPEVDALGTSFEEYVEDCPVCCRPWVVRVEREGGRVEVQLCRDDD